MAADLTAGDTIMEAPTTAADIITGTIRAGITTVGLTSAVTITAGLPLITIPDVTLGATTKSQSDRALRWLCCGQWGTAVKGVFARGVKLSSIH